MTRSRTKAVHDKVNSLLSLHTFDVSVNGSLPHGDTLCILSYITSMDSQDGAKDDQEGTRKDDQEEEEGEEKEDPWNRRTIWHNLPDRPAAPDVYR